jgi:hypothetical protein
MLVPEVVVKDIIRAVNALDLPPTTHLQVLSAVCAPLLTAAPLAAPTPPKPQPILPPLQPPSKPKPPRPATPRKSYDKRTRHDLGSTELAIAFLKQELANGPKPASAIEDLAEAKQISLNALGRAKTHLNVSATRLNSGHGHNELHLQLPTT